MHLDCLTREGIVNNRFTFASIWSNMTHVQHRLQHRHVQQRAEWTISVKVWKLAAHSPKLVVSYRQRGSTDQNQVKE